MRGGSRGAKIYGMYNSRFPGRQDGVLHPTLSDPNVNNQLQKAASEIGKLCERLEASISASNSPAVVQGRQALTVHVKEMLQAAEGAPDPVVVARTLRPFAYPASGNNATAATLNRFINPGVMEQMRALVDQGDKKFIGQMRASLAQITNPAIVQTLLNGADRLLKLPMAAESKQEVSALRQEAAEKLVTLARPEGANLQRSKAFRKLPALPSPLQQRPAAPAKPQGRPAAQTEAKAPPAALGAQRAAVKTSPQGVAVRPHLLPALPIKSPIAPRPNEVIQHVPAWKRASGLKPLTQLNQAPAFNKPGPPVKVAPVSLRTALQEIKIKPKSWVDYAHLWQGRRPKKMSFLTFNGAKVVLTPKRTGGTAGDFRIGYGEDGSPIAIKEMRTAHKVNPKDSKHYTSPLSREMALWEARTTQECRDLIEKHNERFNQPISSQTPLENTLLTARATTKPFQVFGVAESEEQKKLYMLMTSEGGSSDKVLRVAPQLPPEMRGFMITSLAAQTFTELEALHAANIVHLDIKLDNIFFGSTGQFKLMDFGLVQATDPKTNLTAYKGDNHRVTSLMVPEGYAFVGRTGRLGPFPPVGTQLDVWTLAASIVQMSGNSPEFREFFFPPTKMFVDPNTGKQREDTIANSFIVAERIKSFNTWKASLPRRTDDGTIDPTAIQNDNSFYGRIFAPLAKDAPELCSLLVDQGLETRPEKRITAAQFAPRLRAILANVPNVVAKRDMTAQFLADLDGSANPELAHDAAAFRQWAEGNPDRLNLPRPAGTRPVYGIFRNLP